LADEIKAKTGIEAEFIKSGGGVFEVVVDGNLVFSKKELGRFPDHDEIIAKLGSA
jgi:selenoprotein W-related protein